MAGSGGVSGSAPRAVGGRDRAAREAFLIRKGGRNFGIPAGAYRRAIARMRRQERIAGTDSSSATSVSAITGPLAWNSIGPQPLLNETPAFAGTLLGSPLAGATGKVTAIVVDPTVSGRMFVGTAGGGVWMAANWTTRFAPILDPEPTLSVGSMALDTTTSPNPTLYVGGGE